MQQRDIVASACSTQVHWAHKICRSRWKGHVAKQWFNGSHPWKATAPRGTDRSSHSTKLRASKPATMQWLLSVVPAKYWPKRHETQDAVAAMHDPPLLVDDAGVYTLCCTMLNTLGILGINLRIWESIMGIPMNQPAKIVWHGMTLRVLNTSDLGWEGCVPERGHRNCNRWEGHPKVWCPDVSGRFRPLAWT